MYCINKRDVHVKNFKKTIVHRSSSLKIRYVLITMIATTFCLHNMTAHEELALNFRVQN